jgi:hypothetical protein
MRESMCVAVVGILGFVLMACGGPGQTIPLSVNMDAVPAPAKVTVPLWVAVVPFEDMRTEKSMIGRYQHYDLTMDTLAPAGGSAADQITNFVVEYLKRAGFQVSRVRSAEAVAPGSADVVLSGQIEWYWSVAVSWAVRTDLATRNVLVLKATNAGDGSTIRTSVVCDGTRTVASFDLGDLEKLNGKALGQTLARFLADVVVTDRTLMPKK